MLLLKLLLFPLEEQVINQKVSSDIYEQKYDVIQSFVIPIKKPADEKSMDFSSAGFLLQLYHLIKKHLRGVLVLQPNRECCILINR
jgi:hypothetical protein